MKQRILLIVAVLFGIFAAILTREYLVRKDRQVQETLQGLKTRFRQIEVVTIDRDLPVGSILARDHIASIFVYENQLRQDVIKTDEWRDIVGRKIVHSVSKGKPLFWTDIEGGMTDRSGLADSIKPGCRALSINVSGAASVSGMVRPNNRVDVIGTFSFPSKENPEELELVTLTVIQDVTVLATGTRTAKSPYAQQQQASSYSTVTLEVTPREAEMLVFAEQIKGRLSLTLRNSSDVRYEKELPRVNFEKIEEEIETLNDYRQHILLKKRREAN